MAACISSMRLLRPYSEHRYLLLHPYWRSDLTRCASCSSLVVMAPPPPPVPRNRRTIAGAPPAPRVRLRPSPCPGGSAPNRDRRCDRGVCRRSWQQSAPRVPFWLVDGGVCPPVISCPCRESAGRRLEFSGILG